MTLVISRSRQVLGSGFFPGVCVVAGVVGWLLGWHLGVDSAVYRSGAVALLHGEPLYDLPFLRDEPSWARLPFTYPPTAALLFVPLALVPTQVAWGLLGVVSIVGLAWVVRLCVESLVDRPQWMNPVLLGVLALGLEPVWRTVMLGQINLILMAMVVVDVLVIGARGSRWAGVLIGVAAAVKLTPLIFVAHLAIVGRRADALRGLVTFLALQVLLFLLVPHDVTTFWGSAVRDPDRIGPIFRVGNQSLNGLILRLTDGASWSLVAALVVGAALAVPTLLWARSLHRRGQTLPALLATAFLGLLISPVSWSHHWVWAVPLAVFALATWPKAAPAIIAVFASCVLIAMFSDSGGEFRWGPAEFVPGSAYLLVPIVTGGIVLVRTLRH